LDHHLVTHGQRPKHAGISSHWRVHEVALTRTRPSESLGLELARDEHGAGIVRRVLAGSLAARTGELCAGDTIAAVGGRQLTCELSDELLARLLASHGTVRLAVLRPATQAAATLARSK
jgi:C-terminal processing protease CtpA/Prc